jgi:hypothetical protein
MRLQRISAAYPKAKYKATNPTRPKQQGREKVGKNLLFLISTCQFLFSFYELNANRKQLFSSQLANFDPSRLSFA